MLCSAALLALLGAAHAQQPPPALEPAQLQMTPELEEAYESGVGMARFGNGLFSASGIGSLAGMLVYYLSTDEQWQRIGLLTMTASTGVGLVATPLAVAGANRAASAVTRAGRPVPRAMGNVSMALLGLSVGALGASLALYEEDPLASQISIYLGWSLASTSFHFAMRQLDEAEWAHDRPITWSLAASPRGVVLALRL